MKKFLFYLISVCLLLNIIDLIVFKYPAMIQGKYFGFYIGIISIILLILLMILLNKHYRKNN